MVPECGPPGGLAGLPGGGGGGGGGGGIGFGIGWSGKYRRCVLGSPTGLFRNTR